jgi:hypothetical protein
MAKAKRQSTTKAASSTKDKNPAWKAFHSFEKKVNTAWMKLTRDIRKNAPLEVIRRDRDELMFLLGECNYMEWEFSRLKR